MDLDGTSRRETATLTCGSRGDSRRVEIADAIINIVHGRPYDPPKLSIARRLLAVIDSQGIEGALAFYEELQRTGPNGTIFRRHG